MYRCQNCKKTFEEFEVLGQCPFCDNLSKVQCQCGHRAEGWEFVKNNDKCPKCNRPARIAGGMSEFNRIEEPKKKMPVGLIVGVVAAALLALAAGVFMTVL